METENISAFASVFFTSKVSTAFLQLCQLMIKHGNGQVGQVGLSMLPLHVSDLSVIKCPDFLCVTPSLCAMVGAAPDGETWCKPVKLPRTASVAPQVPKLWSYHVTTQPFL